MGIKLNNGLTIPVADARYVNVTGDSMTGDLNMGSNNITITGDIAANANRVGNGYFTNLFATTLVVDATTPGNLTIGNGTDQKWNIKFDNATEDKFIEVNFAVDGAIEFTNGTIPVPILAKNLTLSGASILANATASGILTLGGIGGSNNENLTFDFETNINAATVGTTTGVAKIIYGVDALYTDLIEIEFGTSTDAKIVWQTQGNDNLQIGTSVGSAAQSGYISIMETADIGNANRSPSGTSANPVFRVYSSDATIATDYIEMSHNQTQGILAVGTGNLTLDAPSIINLDSDNGNFAFLDGGTEMLAYKMLTSRAEYLLAIDDNIGNQLVITNFANRDSDHDHAATTDPTLFIHSDTDPNSDNTQWGSFAHDKTNFTVNWGTGDLDLDGGTVNITNGDLTINGTIIDLDFGGAVDGASEIRFTSSRTIVGYDGTGATDFSFFKAGSSKKIRMFNNLTTPVFHFFGTSNTFLGENAGNFTLSGAVQNTCVGRNAGTALTTGDNLILIGHNAGLNITEASTCTLVGQDCGKSITIQSGVTGVGRSCLSANIQTNNTGVGIAAGQSNTTGSGINVFGRAAYQMGETPINICAFGSNALDVHTSGNALCAFGNATLGAHTTGGNCNAFGISTLADSVTSVDTNAFGTAAGGDFLGDRGLFLGHQAGRFITTTDDVLVIDNRSRGGAGADTSSTNSIIYGIMDVTASNQTLSLNADITIGANGNLTFLTGAARTISIGGTGGEDLTICPAGGGATGGDLNLDGGPAATTGGDVNIAGALSPGTNGVVTIGDGGATNYVEVERDGDVNFVAGAGLQYGAMFVNDNVTETAITGTGVANKVQFTLFDNNGVSNGDVTPDHTNDHITSGKTGDYVIKCCITADSVTGAGAEFSFDIFINNGATALSPLHAHRTFSGGGGEIGSIALCGIVNLTANDTVELWIHNETNTQNIILSDVTLSIVQVGGTT